MHLTKPLLVNLGFFIHRAKKSFIYPQICGPELTRALVDDEPYFLVYTNSDSLKLFVFMKECLRTFQNGNAVGTSCRAVVGVFV